MNRLYLIIIFALFCFASNMDYQDEMNEMQSMHNGLGCLTDQECETGIEDLSITIEE